MKRKVTGLVLVCLLGLTSYVYAESTYYYVPCFKTSAFDWSALGISNLSDYDSASVKVEVYEADGSLLSKEIKTINVGAQEAFLVGAGLEKDTDNQGWMKIESDRDIAGLCFIGKHGINGYMADVPMTDTLSTSMVIPHVAQSSEWDTTLYLANPNNTTASVNLLYADDYGSNPFPAYSVEIVANGSEQIELFDVTNDTTVDSGRINISATKGIAAFALYSSVKAGSFNYAGINAVNTEPSAPPSCDSSHVDLCGAKDTCMDAGGYWCDNRCQTSDCNAQKSCTTEECACEKIGGTWTENESEEYSCLVTIECSLDYPWLCFNQGDCKDVEGTWCNYACQSSETCVECSTENLSVCAIESDCSDAGGNWCSGVCQFNECGCDENHINKCEEEYECTDAGGTWCSNKCQESAFCKEKFFNNSMGMRFNLIPAGSFTMGSPLTEVGRGKDESQHPVTLSSSFYLQTTEVTKAQWQEIMGVNPLDVSNCGDDCPAVQLSWYDAQAFIAELNKGGEGTYRLPTEAEWEYAARAGVNTAYYTGDIENQTCLEESNLEEVGWYCNNSGDDKHPVAMKKANSWGLYDMHGNVFEWVSDWYHMGYYDESPETDPQGYETGSNKGYRGGSFFTVPPGCRSAFRGYQKPDFRNRLIGLRLVWTEN